MSDEEKRVKREKEAAGCEKFGKLLGISADEAHTFSVLLESHRRFLDTENLDDYEPDPEQMEKLRKVYDTAKKLEDDGGYGVHVSAVGLECPVKERYGDFRNGYVRLTSASFNYDGEGLQMWRRLFDYPDCEVCIEAGIGEPEGQVNVDILIPNVYRKKKK